MFSWSDTMIKGCPSQIDIYLDTSNKEVWTAGIDIFLDQKNFNINEFDSRQWVFRTYSKAKLFQARKWNYKWKDFIRILWTTSSSKGFKGLGKFGTLTITPHSDQINLEFYMVPGYEGEDSNLASNENGTMVDILDNVENKTIQTISGTCKLATLKTITLVDTENTTVFADKAEFQFEDNTNINKENIFDKSQKDNRFKRNINYLAIFTWLLLIIFIIISSKKSTKKQKKHS